MHKMNIISTFNFSYLRSKYVFLVCTWLISTTGVQLVSVFHSPKSSKWDESKPLVSRKLQSHPIQNN